MEWIKVTERLPIEELNKSMGVAIPVIVWEDNEWYRARFSVYNECPIFTMGVGIGVKINPSHWMIPEAPKGD